MYRGNMGDFIQKLNDYIQRKYDSRIIFGSIDYDVDEIIYYIAFFGPLQKGGAIGYKVFDREDFEDQVIDYVNKCLEYVQGKHDGFLE